MLRLSPTVNAYGKSMVYTYQKEQKQSKHKIFIQKNIKKLSTHFEKFKYLVPPASNLESILGLDLSNDILKVVETSFYEDQFIVHNFSTFDVDELNLKKFTHYAKTANVDFNSRYTAIALNSGDAIFETFTIKNTLGNQELTKNILKLAQSKITIPLSELAYDFKILNQSNDEDSLKILFVAACAKLVKKKVYQVLNLGLYPVVIDIDVFAKNLAHENLKENKVLIKTATEEFYPESFLLALGLSMRIKNAEY